MSSNITLIWLGESPPTPPNWALGQVISAPFTLQAIQEQLKKQFEASPESFTLLWDSTLEQPDPDLIAQLAERPGDIWHAGLRLGMGTLPKTIDFVSPTWMLNRDPDPGIEATSWRLSLRACLIRTEALRQLGVLNPHFNSLAGAGLELGHRLITRGAFMRHVPSLVKHDQIAEKLPFIDELRFVSAGYGKFWTLWALMRAILTGHVSLPQGVRTWQKVNRETFPPRTAVYRRPETSVEVPSQASVSVLIPTVDRYPYLRTLLKQMREQTVRPTEIIVVDQTETSHRDQDLASDFADLPLKMITLDKAGQCSSRNAGLLASRGDHILFIDDDDEISPDLIQKHLANLARFQNRVSSGTAHEVGAGALPENFTFMRTSDVFPTNNTLIQKDLLKTSGLFDLAYEKKQRADGDLGMRVYLTGALMVYNPEIDVLHHHAPSGGLRKHKARVITYASSRQSLFQRHLMSASEVYLGLRYFTPAQVREAQWISVIGTLSVKGSQLRKVAKAAIMFVLLPNTINRLQKVRKEGAEMLKAYPQITSISIRSEP
ncbi:MAG: glycosyltransferase family 2 protein [Anaerolineae bacterium]|nr:glycosyltransferase family 2 protein [Anaerolineae bacterium]